VTLVITGANGEFGRIALDSAIAAAPGERVIASVRDPERAIDLIERGIEVRPGSFDDPDQLRDTFSGADTVLVNATFFGSIPALRGERVTSAIRAAAEAGAERIILTSWPDLDHCRLPEVQDYVASEAALQSAGPDWTILRLGYGLADTLARDVLWGRRDGELVAPAGDATSAPAAVSDLAEAAGLVAVGTGHSSQAYELTGPRAIGWKELAVLASEPNEGSVPYRPVTDDDYRSHLASLGLHETFADGLIALYAAFRSGWASRPDLTLGRLLGRQPVDGLEAVRGRLDRMSRLLARR
jgi:NAD(P)H dehydrogenase (quinone)